jgi:hypothetical protein
LHIAHIRDALDRHLPPQYIALAELSCIHPSLELDFEVAEEKEWMSVVIREFRAAEHKKLGAVLKPAKESLLKVFLPLF